MSEKIQVISIAKDLRIKNWMEVKKELEAIGFKIPGFQTSVPKDAADWVKAKMSGQNPPPYVRQDEGEKTVIKDVEFVAPPEPVEVVVEAEDPADEPPVAPVRVKAPVVEVPAAEAVSTDDTPADNPDPAPVSDKAAVEVAEVTPTEAAAETEPTPETPAADEPPSIAASMQDFRPRRLGVTELGSTGLIRRVAAPKMPVVTKRPAPAKKAEPAKAEEPKPAQLAAEAEALTKAKEEDKDKDKLLKGKRKIEKTREEDKARAKGVKVGNRFSKRDLQLQLQDNDPNAEPVDPNAPVPESTIVEVTSAMMTRPQRASIPRPTQSSGNRRSAPKRKRSGPREEEKKELVKAEIVEISEAMSVRELADLFGVPTNTLVAEFIRLGKMYSINQIVPPAEIMQVAEKLEIMVEVASGTKKISQLKQTETDETKLVKRAPVVTVMGHVDHGKTSLLDAIRKTKVIDTEAGGITQHIGAYKVRLNDRDIVFLDTPGHEAFSSMRARGAQVTDLVILVVAADDGVKPQTKEAISHARSAGVPIVVAINKIDKDGANSQLVKTELMNEGLVPEEYGGDIITAEISAKQKIGLDHLLEMILLQADVLELRADPDGLCKGTVVESKLDKQRGPLATVLVQQGTLSVGDPIVVGAEWGKVRAMYSDRGERITSAGPSTPVEITGLSGVAQAGEVLEAVDSEKRARQISDMRAQELGRQSMGRKTAHAGLSGLAGKLQVEDHIELPIILKADVQGSVEAVSDSLLKLSTQKVSVKIIHSAVGNISESDVALAAASEGVILGFHVGIDGKARNLATQEEVEVHLYDIIYQAVEEIRLAMEGLLAPVREEDIIGHAEVRQVFRLSKSGVVAGCYVTDGKALRNSFARLKRKGELIHDGKVNTLKRFKDDVREVERGFECGCTLDGYTDYQEGDIIEYYTYRTVAAKL